MCTVGQGEELRMHAICVVVVVVGLQLVKIKSAFLLATFTHRAGPWGEQFNKQTAFIDASAVYGCHQVGQRMKTVNLHLFYKIECVI